MRRLVVLAVSLSVLTGVAMAQGTKAPAKPAGKPPAAAPAAAKPAASPLLDINSASKADLMNLPGIGEALSDKIIAGRPYANKAQLKSKKVLPDATYDKIAGQIIAKQAKK